MNNLLLQAALKVIPSQQSLVNVISRRVRQLALGHRPLIAFVPGMGLADVALTEVIEKKLTFESANVIKIEDQPADVLPFTPAAGSRKKAA